MIDAGEIDRRSSERYSRLDAFRCYCSYHDGDEAKLNQVLVYAKKFFIMLVCRYYKRYPKNTKEEIVQRCLLGMWWSVSHRKIRKEYGCYHAYQAAIAKTVSRRVTASFWGHDKYKLDLHEFVRHYYARMPDSRNTEAEILVTEIPGALRRRALKYSRFRQKNVRGALQYCVNRITRKEAVQPNWLIINYNIPKEMVPFYMEHAVIILRLAMYDMRREEIHFRSDNERRFILDNGFEPYAMAR